MIQEKMMGKIFGELYDSLLEIVRFSGGYWSMMGP